MPEHKTAVLSARRFKIVWSFIQSGVSMPNLERCNTLSYFLTSYNQSMNNYFENKQRYINDIKDSPRKTCKCQV